MLCFPQIWGPQYSCRLHLLWEDLCVLGWQMRTKDFFSNVKDHGLEAMPLNPVFRKILYFGASLCDKTTIDLGTKINANP